MAMKLNVFTGKLTINNIEITFVFENDILRLLPSHDGTNAARKLFFKSNENIFTDLINPPLIEEPYLRGVIYERNSEIIFIPQIGSQIGIVNSVITIKVVAYIVFKGKINKFDGLTFYSPEINAIYPVNEAIDFSECSGEKGVYKISTRQFEESETEKRKFTVNKKNIDVYWGISRGVDYGITKYPICVKSTLFFEFEATEDFTFSYTLWNVARKFINYLCYRKNTWLPKVVLSGLNENGIRNSATLKVLGYDGAVEKKPLSDRRCIRQSYIEGHEGDILQDISDNSLYPKHLPDTYHSMFDFSSSRFIKVTVAFEREFSKLPTYSKNQIDDMSLADKFKNALNDLSGIISVFGNYYYTMNSMELNYDEIAKRLKKQRNFYAHGNREEEIIPHVFLDLYFLEHVIYAMQLKRFGVNEKNIQKAIDELFHCQLFLDEIVTFSKKNQQ